MRRIIPAALAAIVVSVAGTTEAARLASLDFASATASAGEVQSASAIVRGELARIDPDIPDGPETLRRLADRGFTNPVCAEPTCAATAGRLLGVDRVVAGRIERNGSTAFANLFLVDVAKGAIERRAFRSCTDAGGEISADSLRRIVRALMNAPDRGPAPQVASRTPPAGRSAIPRAEPVNPPARRPEPTMPPARRPAPETPRRPVSPPSAQSSPLPAARSTLPPPTGETVAGELFLGFLGSVVGGGLGGLLGSAGGDAGIVAGVISGFFLGTTTGVYVVGSRANQTGSFAAALGASIVTTAGVGALAAAYESPAAAVMAIFVAPSVGATIGFNATRRWRSSSAPAAVIDVAPGGPIAFAAPSSTARAHPVDGAVVREIALVRVRF